MEATIINVVFGPSASHHIRVVIVPILDIIPALVALLLQDTVRGQAPTNAVPR